MRSVTEGPGLREGVIICLSILHPFTRPNFYYETVENERVEEKDGTTQKVKPEFREKKSLLSEFPVGEGCPSVLT